LRAPRNQLVKGFLPRRCGGILSSLGMGGETRELIR
jgi:hypothetical protein